MSPETEAYQAYLKLLRDELVPAMGCTEPISVAYAAAVGRDLLGAVPDRVEVVVSGNILKNVKSVIVPNTGGQKGIAVAVAAGILGGKAEKKLEVIAEVTRQQQEAIGMYLKQTPVLVSASDSSYIFDIFLTLRREDSWARVRIVKFHTNVVYLEKDGTVLRDVLADNPPDCEDEDGETAFGSVREILDFVEAVDLDEVKDLLERQIQYNMAVAGEGMRHSYGANIGKVLLSMYGADSVKIRAQAYAAAGSDARMGGCELPVVIVSGSGNQGMTASIPVIVYARELGAPREQLYRALLVSDLITLHQKQYIGRLSAFCGAVSAGCGAAAGIAYLKGGGFQEIAHTVVNGLAISSGIVCDGAKPSCAAKIATAVEAGLMGMSMYEEGQQFRDGEGIVVKGVEKTIKNVGCLGREGMRQTDKKIIELMTQS